LVKENDEEFRKVSSDFYREQRNGRVQNLSAPVDRIKSPKGKGRWKREDGRKKVQGGG